MKKLNRSLSIDTIRSILIALLLFTTQITISNPFSPTSGAKINVATVVLIAIFLWAVLYRIIIKRDYTKLSSCGKKVFWLSIALAAVYLILLILRYIFFQRLTLSVSITLMIAMGVTFYLLFELQILAKKDMINGLTLFVTLLNIYALILLICNKGDVRTSQMVHFTGNINVYVGLILIVTPLLFYWFFAGKRSRFRLGLLISNSVISGLMLLFSGSRYGLIGYLFELALIYLVLFGFRWHTKAMQVGGVILLITALIGTLFSISNTEAFKNIGRTLYYPGLVFEKIFHSEVLTEDGDLQSPNSENPSTSAPEDEPNTTPDTTPPKTEPNTGEQDIPSTDANPAITPDTDNPQYELSDPDHENADPSGQYQSLTRDRLFSRFRNVIEKYWLLGTGRDALYLWGWGYQSTHNLILDAVLCYGILGALVYLLLTCFPLIHFLLDRDRKTEKKMYCIGFLMLLLNSMVQPLLSNKLIILLVVWGCFGAIALEKPKKKLAPETKKTQTE